EGKAAETLGHDQAPRPASIEDGVLLARKPELFRHGHEAFCHRLADTVVGQDDVRSVMICLESGTCRVEFGPGKAIDSENAGHFAEAVRTAASAWSDDGNPSANGRAWVVLTEFSADGVASRWETVRQDHHEILLRNPVLCKDSALARRVARGLADAPGVSSCRATWWGRELDVRFDPGATSAGPVGSAAETAFRPALRPELELTTTEDPKPPAPARGLRRVWYLALAGGSFVLTVVGLIIPGVPTVPFLLATSYYLVRSSPTLNEGLLRTRTFGPIL